MDIHVCGTCGHLWMDNPERAQCMVCYDHKRTGQPRLVKGRERQRELRKFREVMRDGDDYEPRM